MTNQIQKMNKEKGDNYEIQIRDYIINELKKPAYLWKNTPETILIKNGLIGSHNANRIIRKEIAKEVKENPLADTGIDIIQMENDDICSLVQCKNGYIKGVTVKDLAGFMVWMYGMKNLSGYVYYTNSISSKLLLVPPSDKLTFVKQKYIEPDHDSDDKFIADPIKLVYQEEANKLAEKYFKINKRGILSMPCGTGKTYVSYLISQKYDQIIIISPLKEFARQNMERFIEYGYNNKTLLVDSDGERDIETVRKFIKTNKSFLISSTYDSVDVINETLKFMKNPFFIIDEFHNLSKANVFEEDDEINKLLKSDNKILFMSATPRVYELEDEYNVSEIQEELFGEKIYHMNFTEAIKNKYITDYRIWLPSIHEDNSKLEEELSVYEIDNVIQSKCMFLFSCIVNNGSKKCIVYCIDTNELEKIQNAIKRLNQYYYLDYHVSQITCDVSATNRKKLLKDFADSNKIEFMLSVRILDECIDIPKCDSIFITYPTKSKIRTVQRLCRCIRIDKNNSFKMGNVYIWCDEYEMILKTLSGIKEHDEEFKTKIKLNQSDWFGKMDEKQIQKDKKRIEKYVISVKEFRSETWQETFEIVKKYIDENEKRPSMHSDDAQMRSLGNWVTTQHHNYNNFMKNMKDKEIYKTWKELIEEYPELFQSDEDNWNKNLKSVEKYIDKHKKRPSSKAEDTEEKRLGNWLIKTQRAYDANDRQMKDATNRKKWEVFKNKYFDQLKNVKETCVDNLSKCIKYIEENNKLPSTHDKSDDIRSLGNWLSKLRQEYNKQDYSAKNIPLSKKYDSFFEQYAEYFMQPEDKWYFNFEQVEKYVNEFGKLPTGSNKDDKIRYLGKWIGTQKRNYENKKQIMKSNKKIYNDWKEFVAEYSELFKK